MRTFNPADFVGYCGLYCNACGIRQGKIKNAIENLHTRAMGAQFSALQRIRTGNDWSSKIIRRSPRLPSRWRRPKLQSKIMCKAEKLSYLHRMCEANNCENLTSYRKYYGVAFKSIKQHDARKHAEEIQKTVNKGYSVP